MNNLIPRERFRKGIGKTSAFVLSLLVVAVMVLTVGTAGATTFTWDFSSPTGNLGTTETYSSGGYVITVSGFTGVGFHSGTTNFTLPASGVNTANLFGNGSLGVGTNSLIDLGEIVQLDLVNPISAGFTNETKSIVNISGTVIIDGSNSSVGNSATGTYLASFTGATSHTFTLGDPGAYRYEWIYVTPNGAQASLASLTADLAASQVPEPTSLLLLATGLVGIGMGAWRRKK